MIVREIRYRTSDLDYGYFAEVYVVIKDSSGNAFCQDTNTFEPMSSGTVARNAVLIPFIGNSPDPSNRGGNTLVYYFSAPFPDQITTPGQYQVFVYQDAELSNFFNNGHGLPDNFGRRVWEPEKDTSLSHYGSSQPKTDAAIDTSLYATRSLNGAWLLNSGTSPKDAIYPKSFSPSSNVCFKLSQVDQKDCALVQSSLDFTGYPRFGCALRSQKGFGRTWTLMGSISPLAGENGMLFCYATIALLKTSSGYTLRDFNNRFYGGVSFDDIVIQDPGPGFHRWAMTYSAGSSDGYPIPVSPSLNFYLDGDLVATVSHVLGSDSFLVLGSINVNGIPCCAAYHENYFFHRRALTAEEIAQDFLTPYQWYVRPKTFQPASCLNAR